MRHGRICVCSMFHHLRLGKIINIMYAHSGLPNIFLSLCEDACCKFFCPMRPWAELILYLVHSHKLQVGRHQMVLGRQMSKIYKLKSNKLTIGVVHLSRYLLLDGQIFLLSWELISWQGYFLRVFLFSQCNLNDSIFKFSLFFT